MIPAHPNNRNVCIAYASASQPFFNRGTLSWNRSPDGTLQCSVYKNVSIKFISVNLNCNLQAALSISCNFFAVCRSKKSSWWQNCSLTQFLPETSKFGKYLCDLSLKSVKIHKGSKTMSCNNLAQLQQRHKHDVVQLLWSVIGEKEVHGGPTN